MYVFTCIFWRCVFLSAYMFKKCKWYCSYYVYFGLHSALWFWSSIHIALQMSTGIFSLQPHGVPSSHFSHPPALWWPLRLLHSQKWLQCTPWHEPPCRSMWMFLWNIYPGLQFIVNVHILNLILNPPRWLLSSVDIPIFTPPAMDLGS